jgi:hypothetical protein
MTDEATLQAQPPRPSLLYRNGWYVLPPRGGVVTNELIDKIQEKLDRDDARVAWGEVPSPADGL